jgi:hypothetical protein
VRTALSRAAGIYAAGSSLFRFAGRSSWRSLLSFGGDWGWFAMLLAAHINIATFTQNIQSQGREQGKAHYDFPHLVSPKK